MAEPSFPLHSSHRLREEHVGLHRARLSQMLYLFLREKERQSASWGGAERERETQNPKQAPDSEPSAQRPTRGSNSRAMRSRHEPKADAQPAEAPGRPTARLSLARHRGHQHSPGGGAGPAGGRPTSTILPFLSFLRFTPWTCAAYSNSKETLKISVYWPRAQASIHQEAAFPVGLCFR